MIKPIFTIGLPHPVTELDLKFYSEFTQEKMKDYHVLVFAGEFDTVKFEAFYSKDFNNVEFEKFKTIILEEVNKQNTTI